MKKLIIILISLFFSNLVFADPEVVKIFNKNSRYSMFVNYQVCALNISTHCDPPIKNVTINKGQRYTDIVVDNWAFYVRVISAYQLDDEGLVLAYGEFPGEEDCKAFVNSPITLAEKVIETYALYVFEVKSVIKSLGLGL